MGGWGGGRCREGLAVGRGVQELDLGISRGLSGLEVGEKVPQVPSGGSLGASEPPPACSLLQGCVYL